MGQRWQNRRYARRCVRDSVLRGESPIASHLLYTQPGILDDGDPAERKMGIACGLAWINVADATVIYVDRGVSLGMSQGDRAARAAGLKVEYRTLRERPEGFHGIPSKRPASSLEHPDYAAFSSAW